MTPTFEEKHFRNEERRNRGEDYENGIHEHGFERVELRGLGHLDIEYLQQNVCGKVRLWYNGW